MVELALLSLVPKTVDILDAVGFRTSRESIAKSITALQPASPASQSHKNDDEEIDDRIVVEGCTNPGSLLSQRTPWSKGCKVFRLTKMTIGVLLTP